MTTPSPRTTPSRITENSPIVAFFPIALVSTTANLLMKRMIFTSKADGFGDAHDTRDVGDLFARDLGIDREREQPPCGALRARHVAPLIAEMPQGGLQMERHGIVD